MVDENGADDKAICVPLEDTVFGDLDDVREIPSQLREEIEHFFQVYKTLEGKPTRTFGFSSKLEADRLIAESRRRIR